MRFNRTILLAILLAIPIAVGAALFFIYTLKLYNKTAIDGTL